MNQILDVFAGAGFGAVGFKPYFDVVEAIDISYDACKSYRYNHKESKVICKDVQDMSFVHGDYKGIIGLIGTPPCQDFSIINPKRNAHSPRANLIYEYIRILQEVKPHFALFENVFSVPKDIKLRIIKNIEALDYRVVSRIVNAHEYGCAQIRKRWILSIHRKKCLFPKKIPQQKRKFARDVLTHDISEITPRQVTLDRIQTLESGKWVALPGQSYKVYFIVDPNKPLPAIVNPTKLRYIKPDRSGYLSLNELSAAFGVRDFYLSGNLSSKGQQLVNGFPADLAAEFAKVFLAACS